MFYIALLDAMTIDRDQKENCSGIFMLLLITTLAYVGITYAMSSIYHFCNNTKF